MGRAYTFRYINRAKILKSIYFWDQIASFRDISIDKDHAVKLEIFDIVLGALYMVAFAIELLGLIGAGMVRG